MLAHTTRRASVSILIILVSLGGFCTVIQAKKPDKPGDNQEFTPAIVYVENDAAVTVATADGLLTRKLTGGSKGGSVRRYSPTFSPNGATVAFFEKPADANDNSIRDLYLINSDGTGLRFVKRFVGIVERFKPVGWLPSGYLYITGKTAEGNDTLIVDLLDGSTASLGLSLLHDIVGGSSISADVDLSKPGSTGIVTYDAWDAGVGGGMDVHVAKVIVTAVGTVTVDPTTISRLDLPGDQGFPIISPDGLQVAFYDNASADGGDTLAVVDLIGPDGVAFGAVDTLLAGVLAEFRLPPTWSSDSQWIAFTWDPPASGKRSSPFEIAHVRWNGTDFLNMTNSSRHENYPNWNPVWEQ